MRRCKRHLKANLEPPKLVKSLDPLEIWVPNHVQIRSSVTYPMFGHPSMIKYLWTTQIHVFRMVITFVGHCRYHNHEDYHYYHCCRSYHTWLAWHPLKHAERVSGKIMEKSPSEEIGIWWNMTWLLHLEIWGNPWNHGTSPYKSWGNPGKLSITMEVYGLGKSSINGGSFQASHVWLPVGNPKPTGIGCEHNWVCYNGIIMGL